MNDDNPYQSPRSAADPPPAGARFRWRILPTLFCGLYAVACGFAAIEQVIWIVRMPPYRDAYFISIIGVRALAAVAFALATRWWWHARWRSAIILTVISILTVVLASRLKMI